MTDIHAAEQKAAPASIEVHNDGCAVGFYPLTEHAALQVGCPVGRCIWMEPKEAKVYLRHLKQNYWKVRMV